MIDLGTANKKEDFKDKDYPVTYLNEIEVGDEMTGRIVLSKEVASKEFKKNKYYEFMVIIINDEEEKKWVLGLSTNSVYFNDDGSVKVYGTKGGRVYEFIDTFEHVANGTPLNDRESWTILYDTFRENIMNSVEKITVEATQPTNKNATKANIAVIDVVEKSE